MKKKIIAKKIIKAKTSKKVSVKTAIKRSPSVPKVEKKNFQVSLVFSPKEKFDVSGNSIIECLDQIKPSVLKSKGVFIVRSGSLKSEKVMYPFQIKRLLSGSVSKTIFEKNMVAIMK